MLFDVGRVMIVTRFTGQYQGAQAGGDDADLHSILLLVIDGHSI